MIVSKSVLSYPNISKIYCLIRADSPEDAFNRLTHSLQTRKLTLPFHFLEKAIALPGDLTQASLGPPESTLSPLYTNLTYIIHRAWPVNFTLPLSSFTPQFAALQNPLSLSLQNPTPTHLIFYSSVSARIASPHGPVPETPISSFAYASPTGYARAKFVCERIIETAVASSKASATILRISQITPSTTVGTRPWNPAEAIPLMIRAGAIIGSLPLDPPVCGAAAGFH